MSLLEITAASGGEVDTTAGLLDLDEFSQWLQTLLCLASLPQAGSLFRDDLGLDDLQLLHLALGLDRLIGRDAIVDEADLCHVKSLRDLHLYYLTVSCMPNER